jgi:hypothetical protein
MKASEIIDRFGGTSALAQLLDLQISTVHSWRASNSIPEWRRERILEAALSLNIPLSTTDFPLPSERVSKRQAA